MRHGFYSWKIHVRSIPVKMMERLVDVSDLVVENALIPHLAGPRIVRTSTVAS